MKYIIKGDPVPLARPRFHMRRVYDSQKHKKLVAGISLQQQHDNRPFFEGNLQLIMTFFLKIAKKRDISKYDQQYHAQRPDLSNLIKFVEDIGTGILYKDDAIIASVTAEKFYSTEPRTEFEIKVL